ncbi:MAG: cyclic nucleotide-binding domain-containing protein [Actinomycetota bacterium]
MPRKSLTELLGSVSLFEGLSTRELAQIEKLGKEVEFPKNKTIVTEGEDGVGFHLILEGKAKVIADGRKRSTMGPGEWFGELSLIDRGPRTATVTTETPVRTFSLLSWEFLPLLDKNTKIARKIMIEMCRRIRLERSFTH